MSELLSLNPYNKQTCQDVTLTFWDKITTKYSEYILPNYDKVYTGNVIQKKNLPEKTHREFYLTKNIPCCNFYYLSYVLLTDPKFIIDVGCGMNFFKDILPGIHGIDPIDQRADEIAFFNKEFVDKNLGKYDAVISINAIHFVSIRRFSEVLILISKLAKPERRIFVSMGSKPFIDNTPENDLLDLFGNTKPDKVQIASFIDNEIRNLNFNLLVVDNLILDTYPGTSLDGDIRLVFENNL